MLLFDPIFLTGFVILSLITLACLFRRDLLWRFWVWMNTSGRPDARPMRRTWLWDAVALAIGVLNLWVLRWLWTVSG